jgi:HSP20 family protein
VIRPFDTDAWMWDEAVATLERAERRQRQFFALVGGRRVAHPVWEPPIDVLESGEAIWITVALPGVRAEQVTLQVEGAVLVVHTERVPPVVPDGVCIRRMEIPYGVFERRVELPPGRYTLREQRMAEGCLELHLAKE